MDYLDAHVFQRSNFAKSLSCFDYDEKELLWALTENNKIQLFDVKDGRLIKIESMQQETVIYALECVEGLYVTSCKDMPVRLYDIQTHQCIGSISDRKENSERYLSPIGLRINHMSNKSYGCGRKFLSEYDLNRIARNQRLKQFDNKYLSALALQPNGGNMMAVGEFSGEIHFVGQNSIQQSIKCHIDGITDLKFINEHELISSARCDDFKYLWDVRMLNRFVRHYYLKNCSNQRTNIEISSNGKQFLTGNQDGQLWQFDVQQSQGTHVSTPCKSSLNWTTKSNGKIILSSGQRCYQQQPTGHILMYSYSQFF